MPRVLLSARPPMILVVDDSDTGRYFLTRTLRKAGFSVEEAASGIEALRAVVRLPDLVVLDVRLPDIDGFDICRRIKASSTTSHIPVLHVSAAFATPEDQVTGLECGADAYLAQPVDPSLLVATARALLRARRATERLAGISALGSALGSALSEGTPEALGEVVLEHLLALSGAAAGAVYVRGDEGSGEVIAARDDAEEIVARDCRVVFDAHAPLTDAVREGRLVIVESPEDLVARYPLIEDEARHGAWAVIPLRVDGRVIGAVGLAFAEATRFDAEDRALLLAAGAPCAEAIERARLSREVRRLEAQIEALTAAEVQVSSGS